MATHSVKPFADALATTSHFVDRRAALATPENVGELSRRVECRSAPDVFGNGKKQVARQAAHIIELP